MSAPKAVKSNLIILRCSRVIQLVARISCLAITIVVVDTLAARLADDDHLVPVSDFFLDKGSPGAMYRKLWQEKLFITPANVARYVYLPADASVEVAVAVWNETGPSNGNYFVTTTQPSKQLWQCIDTGAQEMVGRKPLNKDSISVIRHEARLPNSTARAIKRVWVAMLLQVRPIPSEPKALDSSTEIFSAPGPHGETLEGQIPTGATHKTIALFNIANMLADYCDSSDDERPTKAAKIEKACLELLNMLGATSGLPLNPKKAAGAS